MSATILELILCLLLALTLAYCMVLERRLAEVRRGQQGLKALIRDLNGAIGKAGEALVALKAASEGAARTLDGRTKHARALADELALITASGERIAERFDRVAPAARAAGRPDGGLTAGARDRLDALRAVR